MDESDILDILIIFDILNLFDILDLSNMLYVLATLFNSTDLPFYQICILGG